MRVQTETGYLGFRPSESRPGEVTVTLKAGNTRVRTRVSPAAALELIQAASAATANVIAD
jgi:hypothetical protein